MLYTCAWQGLMSNLAYPNETVLQPPSSPRLQARWPYEYKSRSWGLSRAAHGPANFRLASFSYIKLRADGCVPRICPWTTSQNPKSQVRATMRWRQSGRVRRPPLCQTTRGPLPTKPRAAGPASLPRRANPRCRPLKRNKRSAPWAALCTYSGEACGPGLALCRRCKRPRDHAAPVAHRPAQRSTCRLS